MILRLSVLIGLSLLLVALPAAADVFETLDRMYEDGRLTVDNYVLYQLYALHAPVLLPPALQAEYELDRIRGEVSRMSGTPRLVRLQRLLEETSPETRRQARSLRARPASVGYVASSEHPFRVHYTNTAQRNRAQQLLPVFEYVWDVETAEIGYDPPVPDLGVGGSDDLDIYFEEGNYGGYVSPENRYFAVSWYAYTCYMALNPQLSDYSLETVFAHEFAHTCQMAMDAAEAIWFLESTATFTQDQVFPDNHYHWGFIETFQQEPYRSLDYFSYGDAYPYGAFIFWRYISERFDSGDSRIVADLWQATKQVGSTNEPDFLDALEVLLPTEHGITVHEARHFRDGAAWGTQSNIRIDRTFQAGDFPVENAVPAQLPGAWGAGYFRFNPPNSPYPLRISFSGGFFSAWSATVLAWRAGSGVCEEHPVSLNPGGSSGALELSAAGDYTSAVLVITNYGQGNHDPDDQDWGTSQVNVSARLVTPVTPTPTPWPTYSPSPSPTPTQPVVVPGMPRILVGGYMDTAISQYRGGLLYYLCLAVNPHPTGSMGSVEVFYEGEHTYLFLADDGQHRDYAPDDGWYGLVGVIPAGWEQGQWLYEYVPSGADGVKGDVWPYLNVR
jgi:hypothetical protein